MKILISYDTNEKQLTAFADGVAIDNLSYVSISKMYSGDDFDCMLETRVVDAAHDTVLCTRLCASESMSAKASVHTAVESKTIPGFLVVPQATKVASDIAAFCKK